MPKLWTCAQIVEFLHERGLVDLDLKWVRNQMDRGKLPCTIVAKRRRARQDLVERMVADWVREAS